MGDSEIEGSSGTRRAWEESDAAGSVRAEQEAAARIFVKERDTGVVRERSLGGSAAWQGTGVRH